MIHLTRKEGKNRCRAKEPVPNINHWQLELRLKTEGNVLNLYVMNKTSERDKGMIEETDLLFSVGPDKKISMGKKKKDLHLRILHPKTEKRAREDEVSLDKIVKERIQDEQVRAEVQDRFQGNQNSKNLKKVQLKCEVFDLRSKTLLDSAISEVIRDSQSKDFGSIELYDVIPRLSCCEGGRDILVVTEHPKTPGTVVPVFQLFDARNNRSVVEEHWLIQPQVLEEDDRTIRFKSPKQEHYDKWSHLSLKLKLRRRDFGDDSESISSCSFDYRQHNPAILDLQNGETSLVCLYCNSGILDGDQTGLTRAPIPQHSGPGRKRRKINHLTVPPPDMIEDPVMLQSDCGTTGSPQTGQEDENNSSSLSTPGVDDEPSDFAMMLDPEMLQYCNAANMSDVQPPRSALKLRMATADGPPELTRAAIPQHSGPGLKRRKMSSITNRNPQIPTIPIANPTTPLATEELLDVLGRLLPDVEPPVVQRSAIAFDPDSPWNMAIFLLMLALWKYPDSLSQLMTPWLSVLVIIFHEGPIIYHQRGLRRWKNAISLIVLSLTAVDYKTISKYCPVIDKIIGLIIVLLLIVHSRYSNNSRYSKKIFHPLNFSHTIDFCSKKFGIPDIFIYFFFQLIYTSAPAMVVFIATVSSPDTQFTSSE